MIIEELQKYIEGKTDVLDIDLNIAHNELIKNKNIISVAFKKYY
jgi:hypothetical protein